MNAHKVVEVKDEFSIQIASADSYRIADDEATFVVSLSQPKNTEIRICKYPLTSTGEPDGDVKGHLEKDMIAFCESVGRSVHSKSTFNIVTNPSEKVKGYVSQAVILWSDAHLEYCCVARGCATQGKDDFYLLHWNGMKNDAQNVIEIFESFTPYF